MKKLLILPVLLFGVFSCAQNTPTSFSEQALSDNMKSTDGTKVTFKQILEKHKGKTIVIDIWASWCPDCIKGMPKVHDLQKQFSDVTYLFLSYDRTEEAWLKGIEKYNVQGDNYLIGSKWKGGAFSESVKLDWIPRYMVVDKKGNIALFRAIEADDEKLISILKQLK
ncbi:TlpA family protein disulfide reductase [Flavobacterium sp. C4GT6]|uniref:TlpA family protein disulfide reductase n=1 Tax=Flavobacterium sp. C4GT6 TaxID=3103818 RepID=UPI002ED112F9